MRIGTIISVPDLYTRYARIKDDSGGSYTVDPSDLPKNTQVGDRYAYKVELGGNDGGLAYALKDDE